MDVKLPRWLDVGWNFIPRPVTVSRRDYLYARANLAIDEINVDMVCYAIHIMMIKYYVFFIYD